MVLLGSTGSAVGFLIYLVFVIFEIAALWLVFAKADRPGWGAIIPIYNVYLICKVAKRPGWWLVLFLIPLVNIVIAFIVFIDVAKAFGKSTGFGVLLTLFGFVCIPILGFGAATYGAAPVAA
jgi:hypothetical protein